MRTPPWWTVSLLVLIARPHASLGFDDAPDFNKLQGAWSVISAEHGGTPVPEEKIKDGKLVLAGDRFTWKTGDQTAEGAYTVDATKSPRQITLSHNENTLSGIYVLDGENLKLCVSHGSDRPTEFTTKEGDGCLLLVLRRAKP